MNDAGPLLRGLTQGAVESTVSGLMPQILCGPDFSHPGQPEERLSGVFEGLAATFGDSPAVLDNGRAWSSRGMAAEADRPGRPPP